MKKSMNNKGITLITLVITIIVLMILAGVGINALTGEKSVIKEAKDAKSATELARIQEEIELLAIQALKNKASTGTEMATYVQNNLPGVKIYKTADTYVRFDYKGEDIVLHDTGKVTMIEKVYTKDNGGANMVIGEINLINSVVENDTLVVPNYYKTGTSEFRLTKIISNNQYELHNANITAKKIIISDGIETIGSAGAIKNGNYSGAGIFAHIKADEIYLPSTLLEIGDYAFHGNNIKEIVIPKSVEKMGYSVFVNGLSLEKIYCEAASQPEGWDEDWNISSAEVIWGYGQ